MTAIKVILVLLFLFFLIAISLPTQINSLGSAYVIYNGPCGTNRVATPSDTLETIAKKCGVTINDLLAANPSLNSGSQLHEGQRIYMPKTQHAVTAADQNGAEIIPNTGAETIPNTGSIAQSSVPVTVNDSIPITTYVIQPGDTLSKLALRYNTSVEVLLSLNPSITDQNRIYVGHELKVP